jgi:hypothetical protein
VSSPSNIRHADIVTCEFVKPAFPQTLPWQDQSRTTYQVPAELLEVALDKKKKKKKKKKKRIQYLRKVCKSLMDIILLFIFAKVTEAYT